jgi:hypothetical protein
VGRKDQDKMMYYHTFKDLNPRIHILFMLSSSFEQPITERDVNSCENASNIQIIDERIGSSSDQSEINAFSPEIGNKNVESFSLEDDTIHSHGKEKKANGT